MRTTLNYTHLWVLLGMLATCVAPAFAQDPGLSYPATSQVSDQKAGSLLVFNIYTSSIVNQGAENARLSITNTNAQANVAVHLFFVDGNTCSVADAFICLTKTQTATFLASDIDPGVTGYVVAVAVDGTTGCPRGFNYLIGDVYVKFTSGHRANLGAEAFAANFEAFATCSPTATTATLYFDGAVLLDDSYNFLPRVLAIDSLPSVADGNSALLIINRIGGNLAGNAATIGALFGVLYDDQENAFSFAFNASSCQFRSVISNSFPRTTPRISTLIPAGHTGWMRLWADDPRVGLLGVLINFNPNATSASQAFNSGHNLHKLSINTTGFATIGAPSIIIPVIPPNC
jgi:hypothetical protein